MRWRVQSVRRSQLVLIYGPGSVIETRNGPRLIPLPNIGLGRYFTEVRNFRISDSRLETAVKSITGRREEVNIFSVPTNAALGLPESLPVYSTYIFPAWRVCYGRTKQHPPIIYPGWKYKNGRCPLCDLVEDSSALRFVAACTAGHLDDVDWIGAVHGGRRGRCNPKYLYWRAGGSSLADIEVKCPDCGKGKTLERIYRTKFDCTGRSPEREEPPRFRPGPAYTKPVRPGRCDRKMRVTQRQSSSLYIPETITLVTIPEYDTSISRVLQRRNVSAAISSFLMDGSLQNPCKGTITADRFLELIEGHPLLSDEEKSTITEYIKENGIESFCRLFDRLHGEERTFLDFIYEEFESLLVGPRASDNFCMSGPVRADPPHDAEVFPQSLLVYPVRRIRSVTVQRGYRRVPVRKAEEAREEPELVPTSVPLEGASWYLGFEGHGEGIFITSDKTGFMPAGDAAEEWKASSRSGVENLSRGWGVVVTHPLFVWMHTLSHAIIRKISLYAGYSSPSLRERIYINRERTRAGILIYTTSPGDDASMGGLVEAVYDFDEILEEAIAGIRTCSNDPLCGHIRKSPERVNGAACYSCLFISETSCEHGNRWLDRHVILGD